MIAERSSPLKQSVYFISHQRNKQINHFSLHTRTEKQQTIPHRKIEKKIQIFEKRYEKQEKTKEEKGQRGS